MAAAKLKKVIPVHLWGLCAIMLLCPSTDVLGQVVEERAGGEKVIVFPDGSWRPFTDRDSFLLKTDDSFMIEDESGIDVLELPKGQDDERVPVKSDQYKAEVRRLTNKIEQNEGKYEKFKMDPSIPPQDISKLQDSIAFYKAKLETFRTQYKPSATVGQQTTSESGALAGIAVMPTSQTLWLQNCDKARVSIDPLKGYKTINMPKSMLFQFNIPELSTRIGQRPFMVTSGAINAVGSFVFLSMEIKLASSAAVLQYGPIDDGEVVFVKLVDGSLIKLNNLQYEPGKTDPHNEESIYTLSFQLQSSDLKKLKRSEASLIRIIWQSGYEDYPMTNVRFFMDQLSCLDEHS